MEDRMGLLDKVECESRFATYSQNQRPRLVPIGQEFGRFLGGIEFAVETFGEREHASRWEDRHYADRHFAL
jgi:hypothetical protein